VIQHPGVADCAVVGTVSADGTTEAPRAYVVRIKGTAARNQITADEVYDFVKQRLVSYKRLDGGVVFVASIPRTASGKIQRFKLSDIQQRNDISEGSNKHGIGLPFETLGIKNWMACTVRYIFKWFRIWASTQRG
jgi:acyl-coenzyme A synthetase/AMP-(fatty) acid ligase